TINKGIQLASAQTKDVYISKGTYTESVVLAKGVSLYGGYDPANNWSRALTNNTVIQAPTSTAVFGQNLVQDAELQLLNITSTDAPSAGGSSYGILVVGSPNNTMKITACKVSA